MKVSQEDIGGEIIRDTEVYLVIDNKFLNNLTLSKTILYPTQKTGGHSHEGLEEVYFFKTGTGVMKLDDTEFLVRGGDIVLIPDGAFHQVFNTMTDEDLEFVCVFQSYTR